MRKGKRSVRKQTPRPSGMPAATGRAQPPLAARASMAANARSPGFAYDVSIVGLGYVGLTLAAALAERGVKVLGIERRREVLAALRRGRAPFFETGLDAIIARIMAEGSLHAAPRFAESARSDVYIITVGTPLRPNGKMRLDFIERALRSVADNMGDGALVMLRSTSSLGTARAVAQPLLQASGKRFQLAVCPERTLEGEAMRELQILPQIIGADEEATRARAADFFRVLTNSIVQVPTLETAELIKLADNSYRDVSFAFGNEMARICEAFGVRADQVIANGQLGYARTRIAQPGLVGGPCLSKDSHILMQSCEQAGFVPEIVRAARLVNERQPAETVRFVLREHRARFGRKAPLIALCGLAFKGEPPVDDLRGAMSLQVLRQIRRQAPAARLTFYDPVCRAAQLRPLVGKGRIVSDFAPAIAGAEIVLIANNHARFGRITPQEIRAGLKARGFVYDYWNMLDDAKRKNLDTAYFALGDVARRTP